MDIKKKLTVEIQNELVEIPTTGFRSDILMDHFWPQSLQRHRIHQRLAARLQGERNVGVSDGKPLAVDGADADAPIIRVHPRQLGNVAGHFSIAVAFGHPVYLFNIFDEVLEVGDDELALERPRDQNDVRRYDLFESFSVKFLGFWRAAFET